jgi:hypothetical protein
MKQSTPPRKLPPEELEENLVYFDTYLLFFEESVNRALNDHQAAQQAKSAEARNEYYSGMLFSIKRCREFFLDCRTGRLVRAVEPLQIQNLVDPVPSNADLERDKKPRDGKGS